MTKLVTKIGLVPMLMLATMGPAYAYLGPGGVISGVGSLLALIAAVVVAIIGFLWFPIKRLIKRKRGPQQVSQDASGTDSPKQDP